MAIEHSCIKSNQSDPFRIGNKYGGIPRNLLTNVIGWATLLVGIYGYFITFFYKMLFLF